MPERDPAKEPPNHAVVLPGGGANGAYEIGTLKALVAGKCPPMQGAPFDPEIFCGTSVGSFNAAYRVSRWEDQESAAISPSS